MSYIEKNLPAGEEVKLVVKKNPLFLVLPWRWGVLGIWLFFILLIEAIKKTIAYIGTEYVITNKKVHEKYGLISTHTDEMPLTRIENITCTYSFWGKLFNYGTVCIQGANINNVIFKYVKDAEQVKKDISALIG
ncbi:MAG: PH domain-containing protein [Bacilli bacterium]|nr:PH domain-containing protein [Bacilli bacterium]